MQEKNIDQKLIKISGKFPIERQLALAEEVKLKLRGAVVKIETLDNQDGSVNQVYVVKPLELEEIKH